MPYRAELLSLGRQTGQQKKKRLTSLCFHLITTAEK